MELACEHDEVKDLLRDIVDFASTNFDVIYDQHDKICELTEVRMPKGDKVVKPCDIFTGQFFNGFHRQERYLSQKVLFLGARHAYQITRMCFRPWFFCAVKALSQPHCAAAFTDEQL